MPKLLTQGVSLEPKNGRQLIGIVAGFKSERWPVIDRNAGRLQLGIRMRVANTGISAVVDAYGRIVDSLPLGTAGVIDATLPRPVGRPTVYGRFGNGPVLALIAAMLFTAGVSAIFTSRHRSGY